MSDIPEYIDGVLNVAGSEKIIEKALADGRKKPVYMDESPYSFENIRSACTVALHMHQPLIPAGGGDLHTAAIISNLQHMKENQGIGDNHNAPVFEWCYKRIGEFVPDLVGQGKEPRVMLEYSGTLFHGLRQMGNDHIIDCLREVTVNPAYRRCVEWLGCPWGHAVAPSTPPQDYRLHVKAWQHHFAALFGLEALGRVRGFSPSEMALPNHPDIAYEYIKTLKDCGFDWLLVQEHSVEQPEDGHHPHHPHLPHRLVCRNSEGEEVSIVALVKTQGSDTKLVAQMQPYYECTSLGRVECAGKSVPPLVSQIADGENGGVMMNEFPGKFHEVAHAASHSDTPLMNGTEYLEFFFAQGIKEKDLPVIQPVKQKRLFEACKPGSGSKKMAKAIEKLKEEDHQFHMDGGSWTNSISWVEGYDNVLKPMERVSSLFHEKVIKPGLDTDSQAFRNALFHLMSSQTSCYRYWGQGEWTDYGVEICRRAEQILENDL